MSELESWMPSDEEIRRTLINMGGILDFSSFTRIVRALIRTAVERALAEANAKVNGLQIKLIEQEARHKREVIEALIYELDNATSTVCQGCAEGIDYWPADGSHRRQISDDGDCEGGPCNCHELSDRLHGLRAELAALEEEGE